MSMENIICTKNFKLFTTFCCATEIHLTTFKKLISRYHHNTAELPIYQASFPPPPPPPPVNTEIRLVKCSKLALLLLVPPPSYRLPKEGGGGGGGSAKINMPPRRLKFLIEEIR